MTTDSQLNQFRNLNTSRKIERFDWAYIAGLWDVSLEISRDHH